MPYWSATKGKRNHFCRNQNGNLGLGFIRMGFVAGIMWPELDFDMTFISETLPKTQTTGELSTFAKVTVNINNKNHLARRCDML